MRYCAPRRMRISPQRGTEIAEAPLPSLCTLCLSVVKLFSREELSMSFHKITIVGNLGRDPELRYTPQGTAVCNFTVAVNERWQDSTGGTQERATWFRVAVWGKRAETVNQYLKKGSQVYVEGRLSVREYTDRTGASKMSLDVNASDVQFLDRRQTGTEQDSASDFGTPEETPPATPDNEVPF
jgi:single-strand DNA-binding protein